MEHVADRRSPVIPAGGLPLDELLDYAGQWRRRSAIRPRAAASRPEERHHAHSDADQGFRPPFQSTLARASCSRRCRSTVQLIACTCPTWRRNCCSRKLPIGERSRGIRRAAVKRWRPDAVLLRASSFEPVRPSSASSRSRCRSELLRFALDCAHARQEQDERWDRAELAAAIHGIRQGPMVPQSFRDQDRGVSTDRRLPASCTSCRAREEPLRFLGALYDARMVTLTGVGGSGKTRCRCGWRKRHGTVSGTGMVRRAGAARRWRACGWPSRPCSACSIRSVRHARR